MGKYIKQNWIKLLSLIIMIFLLYKIIRFKNENLLINKKLLFLFFIPYIVIIYKYIFLNKKLNKNNIFYKYNLVVHQKYEMQALYEQLEAYNQTIDKLNIELNESINKYEVLVDSIYKIFEIKNYDEIEYLKKIYCISKEIINKYDYGAVFTFENNHIKYIETDGYDIEKFEEINILQSTVEKSYPKTGLYKTKDSTILHNIEKEKIEKFNESSPISKEIIYLSIKYENNTIGGLFLEIDVDSNKAYNENDIKIIKNFQLFVESYYKGMSHIMFEENKLLDIVKAMTCMLEFHDVYTKQHSLNVASYSKSIGEAMNMSKEDVNELYLIGLLHDIGKTFISTEILNKKEKLTESEYKIICEHPVTGAKILNQISNSDKIRKSVRHHHERWDGKGYPDGLKGTEILLETQIITIADAYDAMMSDRPYREAFSKEKAIKEVKENRGTQFSPEICDVFLEIFDN